MITLLPLEIYISDVEFFGALILVCAVGFLILALMFLLAKYKKGMKVCLIISGCCLLIGSGMCGFFTNDFKPEIEVESLDVLEE